MNISPDVQTAPEEFGPLNPKPHPFLPSPTRSEIDGAMATPEGAAAYLAWYRNRETLIARSEQPGEMIRYAFELDCWRDFDRDLAGARTDGRDYGGIYVGGGKRSTKSSKAARTCVHSWLTYGQGIAWGLQRELPISRITMQRMLWEWLPQSIREKNDVAGKRKNNDPTKIRYSPDGGFTENTLVLPNGTLVMFLSYKMDPKDYQGAEIGARIHRSRTAPAAAWPWIARVDDNGVAYYANGLPIPNIGAWLDEDAPLSWVSTVRDRLTTRNAKFIWTFTTENGITRAVKEVLGEAQNIETRPAEDMLPQDRVLVRGCRPGHVPYRQRTATPGVNAIFFHTRFNVFGDNYANMAAKYAGKDERQVLANMYGYSEDLAVRAYPLFGGWNVVDEHDLPAEGTNYLFGDPAGARNWAWLWVRVCPGLGGEDWYIYDEWPEFARYGAWAIPDERAGDDANPDGVAGPAQQGQGWGVERYKRMIAEKESLVIPAHEARACLAELDTLEPGSEAWRHSLARHRLADAQRRALVRAALEADDAQGTLRVVLPVRARYLDPRAGSTAKEQQKGSKTLFDLFREETRDAAGQVTGPRMRFDPAPGLNIEQCGLPAVQKLLYFDDRAPIVRGLNAPRLHVVAHCRQTRWMFENYTAQGGESGGCKDFADLVRYAATSPLRYVAPGMTKTTGGIHRDR